MKLNCKLSHVIFCDLARLQSTLVFCALVVISGVSVSACGGSGSSSNAAVSSNDELQPESSLVNRRVIRGIVYNSLDRQPVAGATIVSSPVTQTVRTNLDGSYQIIDTGGVAGSIEYSLRIAKSGYQPTELRVGATIGENLFDIPVLPSVISLLATPDQIDIPFERNTATFFVNGSYSRTDITVLSDVSWLNISPTNATIVNSDGILVTATVDRAALGSQSAIGTLTVRADSGDVAIVSVDVEVNSIELPRDSAEVVTGVAPTLRPNQADCRRDDILRVATDNPDMPLVVFPQTAVLPGDEGSYTINQLPFLVYADSFQINKRGTLTLRHTSGGDATTGGTIFDIDRNNYAEVLADDSTPVRNGRRSALEVALEPGIYCYLLRPANGIFLSFSQLRLQVDFSTE
ncbi:hypothetical protein AB833_31570 [Chromatiales bacterium (ex Bugula neritina AB1)]|nr:hypothetical protein AB833_31570 [Chromatiales bacterium (ex Bugula neritina AB1)]